MVSGASNFEEKGSINDEKHHNGLLSSEKAVTSANLTLESTNPLITVSAPTGKENILLQGAHASVDEAKHQEGCPPSLNRFPTSEPIGIVLHIVYMFIILLFITESDKEAPKSGKPAVSSHETSVLVKSLPTRSIESYGMSSVQIYMTANLLNDNLLGTNAEILNHIAVDFTKYINLDALLPYLQSHQMLTNDQVYYCRSSSSTPTKKAKELLRLLKQKGKKSLQKLLCCLTNETTHSGHKNVATKLKDAMELYNFNGKLVCPVCQKPILNKGEFCV